MDVETFMIYYGNNACTKKLNAYQTLILDPDNYTDVNSFSASTYAYLSIGEVNEHRDYFNLLKNENKILSKNSVWGSYLIKFDSYWENLLISKIIPEILAKGYTGIMLDNIDAIVYYKTANKDVLIDFINSLKLCFPKLQIMVNRGFEIINELEVDSVLLESTISTHDFETKEYLIFEEPIKFKIKNNIKCYSVDYWPTHDFENIKKIRNLAKNEGYVSLVTDISLQQIN